MCYDAKYCESFFEGLNEEEIYNKIFTETALDLND